MSDGEYYVLFSLNNTDLPTVIYVSRTKLQFLAVVGTGTIQLKMDNTDWKEYGEPHSITIGSYIYGSSHSDWSYTNHVFTFPIQFSTKVITINWEEAPSDGTGGPISPIIPVPPLPPVPPEPEPEPPIEEPELYIPTEPYP